jgi:hypothetical protein
MTTKSIETATHCAYCGRPIPGDADAPERFGERFCTDAHADEFAAGVRAKRMEAVARADTGASKPADQGGACALPATGQRNWRDYLKHGACWGAPLLLLLAVPLFWSGGWGAAGGTLLTAIAFLACPLGMYFMMRAMTKMHQQGGAEVPRDTRDKGDRDA